MRFASKLILVLLGGLVCLKTFIGYKTINKINYKLVKLDI